MPSNGHKAKGRPGAFQGFRFSKALGQNFLTDTGTINKIADAAGVGGGDTVVEIGAGAGALTAALSERAGRVIAIEVDTRAMPWLSSLAEARGNVEAINADFMKFDLDALPERYTLVGNLPYSITTPILAKALEHRVGVGAGGVQGARAAFSRAVFMVQKEVAERLCAAPGGRDYGAISVLAQYACETALAFTVGREVFVPKPTVDSAVVVMDPRANDGDDPEVVGRMFALVRAGFNMRRKTLRNALAPAGYPEAALLDALGSVGIDPARRAETLSPRDWYAVAERLGGI